MSNCLFGYPIQSDVSATYTPTFSGGSFVGALPAANMQDPRLELVARFSSSALKDTRFSYDLKRLCRVGAFALARHTISQAGRARFLARADSATLTFDYEAGDDISTISGSTFSRTGTTPALYHDAGGVVRSPGTVTDYRDGAFYTNVYRIGLVQPTRTNLALRSQNFSHATWGKTASAAVDNVATAPDGTLTAASWIPNVGTTGSGGQLAGSFDATVTQHSTSFYVKPFGPSPLPVMVQDGGGDGFTINTSGAITSTSGSIILQFSEALANGWFRLGFTQGVAQNETIVLLTAGGGTWDGVSGWYVWGAQMERGIGVTSYMVTTSASVTRNADVLSFSYAAVPVASTHYFKFLNLGVLSISGAALAEVTNTGPANPAMLFESNGNNTVTAYHNNGSTQVSSTATFTGAVWGSLCELRVTIFANGSIQAWGSVGGGAEVTSGQSAANTFAGSWATPTKLFLGNVTTAGTSVLGILAFRVINGTQSLATMQASVYDSGWLDVWPAVFPVGSIPTNDPRYATGKFAADDAGRVNIGLVNVPASTFQSQYGSVQIDDALNAATIDLSRLVVMNTYQPTLNLIFGAKLGVVTQTVMTEMDGGGRRFNTKPQRREQVFTIEDIGVDEALVNGFDMQRYLGINNQLFFIFDPADTYHMHRRSMLCTLRELNLLDYPYVDSNSTAYALSEVL